MMVVKQIFFIEKLNIPDSIAVFPSVLSGSFVGFRFWP